MNDINNPLEDIKVQSALRSEEMKLSYRKTNNPKDVNILDYTVIAALKKQLSNGWIPITEGLPVIFRDDKYEELIPFLVCLEDTDYPFRAYYDGKIWGDGVHRLDVIAWQPLPEPYKA